MIEIIIFLAGLITAIWVLCYKWRIFEFYQAYRPAFLPSGCNFCFFFWLSQLALYIQSVLPWLGLFGLKMAFPANPILFVLYNLILGLIISVFSLHIKPKA